MLKDNKFNASIYSTPIFCIYHDADDFHSCQENFFFLIVFKYKCAFTLIRLICRNLKLSLVHYALCVTTYQCSSLRILCSYNLLHFNYSQKKIFADLVLWSRSRGLDNLAPELELEPGNYCNGSPALQYQRFRDQI